MVREDIDKSGLDDGVGYETVSNHLKSMLADMNDLKNLSLCSFLFVGKTFDEKKLEPKKLKVDYIHMDRSLEPAESRRLEMFDHYIEIEHA